MQLFEFHDLPWFPSSARDALTDFLGWFAVTFQVFQPAAPILAQALREAGARDLVDLCTGSGVPALALAGDLDPGPRTWRLTDLHPNPAALARVEALGAGVLRAEATPVDATAVPEGLRGFRTLFASFHHFPPEVARAILQDAVDRGEGIAVFEYTERSPWVWGPALLATPALLVLVAPFVRPFRWSRLLWTWLLPPFWLAAVWDGAVSCLRTYDPDELLELVPEGSPPDYAWRAGRVRSFGGCFLTWLVGVPGGPSPTGPPVRSSPSGC